MTRTKLGWAIAIFLAVSIADGPAGAKEHAHEAHPSRVQIVPGVTFTLSSDWYACDRDLNAQFHDRPLPETIAAAVCRPPKSPTAVRINNLLVHSPVSLVIDRFDVPHESLEALSQATPEMVSKVDKIDCGTMPTLLGLPPQSVTSCATTLTRVSDHPALLTRVSIADTGKMHELRVFDIPYDHGELLLQFESLIESDAAASKEIDAVIDSLVIEPGNMPLRLVPFHPAPGISLSIPYGWESCDKATNDLLGDDPDPLGVLQKSCSPTNPDVKLAVFNPQLLQNMTIYVSYWTNKEFTESQVAGFSSDNLTEMTPSVCQSVTQPLKNDMRPVDSCVLSVEQIGGHAALVATVVGAFSYDSETERSRSLTYFVPYEEGYASIEFIVPLIGETASQELVDTIMKTIVIGKATPSESATPSN